MCEWKHQSQGLLRRFRGSPCDWLAGGTSSREKHLDNFFFLSKFCLMHFWQLALATCSQLNPVAKNLSFSQWGSFSGQVSKLFIFPSHLLIIHLLVYLSLFQNHRVHSQTLHILPHFFTNLQEKVWILFLSHYISHLCLWFLGLGVFDDVCEYDAWIWVFDALVRLRCGFCWLCVITLCLWLHMCYLWHRLIL